MAKTTESKSAADPSRKVARRPETPTTRGRWETSAGNLLGISALRYEITTLLGKKEPKEN